jgi:hypothetical protein
MARPIKETPVLKGQDAIRFLSKINNSQKPKATQQEKDKIRSDYEALKSIATF